MQYGTKAGNPARTRTQCLIVGIYESGLTESASVVDKASKGQIRKVIKRGDITGKANQTLLLHDVSNINAQRILLVGLGKEETFDGARFVAIANATANALKSVPASNMLCCLLDANAGDKSIDWKTRQLVVAFGNAAYKYTDMKGTPPEENGAERQVDFQLADKDQQDEVREAIRVGSALASGIAAHKDVANAPSNVCTPTYLAEQAKQLARDHKSITTKVVEEKEMEKLGMGAFLSVGKGSVEPSKLIIIEHKGGKPKDQPHIIVGKGITFDSGGISLKPGATMYEMIYDMCGAASVFGTMTAVAEQNLPMNVIGVIAAAENMPAGNASKPGDIVKTMSGQTVEILNTDAEGRLVLCDALTYIDKYNPATVVDIATLTGAMVIALGSAATGMFANDDGVAENLTKAGEDSHDRVWRMPIWDEYQTQINSAFADIQNIGGREAGSITAACFLSRFTRKYRWAHLDIAGTSYKWAGVNKGATGRPVALLTQYLNDRLNDE